MHFRAPQRIKIVTSAPLSLSMFMTVEKKPVVSPIIQSELKELRDEDIVRRVLAGETALFEIVMRRYNQRLYRVARIILRNDGEAEDVMQDAYVRAYEHLSQFAGRAAFSTWLTRIAVHEALARKRRSGRMVQIDDSQPNSLSTHGDAMPILKSS